MFSLFLWIGDIGLCARYKASFGNDRDVDCAPGAILARMGHFADGDAKVLEYIGDDLLPSRMFADLAKSAKTNGGGIRPKAQSQMAVPGSLPPFPAELPQYPHGPGGLPRFPWPGRPEGLY